MALSYTNRGTQYHASNTSVTSASFTPAAGALLVVMVETISTGSGAPTITLSSTFSGQGAWTSYNGGGYNGFEYQTTLIAWSVCGGSPGSGTITVSRSGGGSPYYGIFAEFVELSGQDATTPIRQNKTNNSATTSLALNFTSAPLSDSITFFTVLGENNPTTPSGTTGLGSQQMAGTNWYGEHAYDTSPAQNNSWTGVNSFYTVGAAIEVAASQGATAAVSTVARSITIPAVTAFAGIIANVAKASTTMAAPAATAKASSTSSPAVVARSIAVPAVQATQGAVAKPAAVARAITIPAAIAVADSNAAVAAAALVLRIPDPTVYIDGVPVFNTVPATPSDADLLDMVVSMRAEKVRFDLLDSGNVKIGEIHPKLAPSISNKTGSGIKRRLSGLWISADEYADVDPIAHRVRPVWVLENGSEYPLGIYLFADASTHRRSYGLEREATLVDQGLILNQPLASTISFPAGTNYSAAIRTVAEAAGVHDFQIDASSGSLGSPVAWQGNGRATYLKVIEDLCTNAGFHSPYFTNAGQLRCRVVTDLAAVTPTLRYLDGGRILAASMIESNDLLTAPNRIKALDTANAAGPIEGAFEFPATAPHSYARRGFWITKTIETPGIGTQAAADAAALAYAVENPIAYESVTFASPADPRHETFDAVNYRGTAYLEVGWTLKLAQGGPMAHEVRRVYTA